MASNCPSGVKNLLSTPARSRRRRCRGSETAAGMLRWQVALYLSLIHILLSYVDGKTIKIMSSAQDHKRAKDGDQGLNTGGMGNFSPSPFYTCLLYTSRCV